MKLIDLTHVFDSSTPVYPGDPKSSLVQTAFIDKDTYNDHKLVSQMHVGTHIDAPFHMINNGKLINEIPLETFIGHGVLINAENKKEINVILLNNIKINSGDIVLVYTGFSKNYYDKKYFENCPIVNNEFAEELIKRKIKMIGFDFSGPDVDLSWPVHKIFLGANIPIIENLNNLDKLIGTSNFEIIAFPLNLKSDASPLRVLAKIE